MKDTSEVIPISEFKIHALRLISMTAKNGREYIITNRGIPVARVVTVKSDKCPRRGSLKGMAEICGDIVKFSSSKDWEVLKE